jgi:hypothetical protein
MNVPDVRDRSLLDPASKKIEYVAPEEIAQAIYSVVQSAFSLSREDVSVSASRILGFQRLVAESKQIFEAQLAKMIKAKVLELREGRVFLAEEG